MDGLNFIAEIAKAVAWPFAAVLLCALFLKQLADLSKALS